MTKVLISTIDTQGQESDDFFLGSVDEVVVVPWFVCHPYPSSCGCDRCWSGLDSDSTITTTAIVGESSLTEDEMVERALGILLPSFSVILDEPSIKEFANLLISDTLEIADRYASGTVIGIHFLSSDNDDTPRSYEIIIRRMKGRP